MQIDKACVKDYVYDDGNRKFNVEKGKFKIEKEKFIDKSIWIYFEKGKRWLFQFMDFITMQSTSKIPIGSIQNDLAMKINIILHQAPIFHSALDREIASVNEIVDLFANWL